MIFNIRSRADIQKIPFEDDQAVISISTPKDIPNTNYPKINAKNVVFIECDDVCYNSPNIIIIGHQSVESVIKYFSTDDAMTILEFFDSNIDKEFFIHCDMGISRSPGVAVGLTKIIGFPTDSYYKRFKPNELIVNTIFNCYCDNRDKFVNINNYRQSI